MINTPPLSNPFEWIRSNISATGFVETEFPGVQLTPGGRPGVYYGPCPIHQETNGESFLVDENTGRICCYGKCNMKGADICEIAAARWHISRKEAAKRIRANAGNYNAKAKVHKGKKEKIPAGPRWCWERDLEPFPSSASSFFNQPGSIAACGRSMSSLRE